MTTVTSWSTNCTVMPEMPRAATTTWSSSPAVAMASSRIRYLAIRGWSLPDRKSRMTT